MLRALTFLATLISLIIVAPIPSQGNDRALLRKEFLTGYKFIQSGEAGRAVVHLERIKDLDVAVRDYILYYLGKGLVSEGRCREAKTVFSELIHSYPESRWRPAAQVYVNTGESCLPPDKAEAQISIGCGSLPSLLGDRAADCYFRSRRYREAKEIYKKLAQNTKGTKGPQKRGLFHLVRLSQAAARSQDLETALWANRTIRQRYPKTKEAKEALRKIAFLYQDHQDFQSALPVLEEILAASRSGRSNQERRPYREQIGWCRFRLGQYERAIQAFNRTVEEEETPFSLYWKGRSLERLGEVAAAIEVFQSLVQIYNDHYYGIRAFEKLHGRKTPLFLSEPSLHGALGWEKKTASIEATQDLERIYELRMLGLIRDAEIEVVRARARLHIPIPNDPKELKRLQNSFVFQLRLPSQESLDYPLPYADFLFTTLRREKVTLDPYLLYAMMRQESRYREAVVSPAGAVGLLQIMPGTGRLLAQSAGWEDYQTSWLYDPLTNIELAVRYVKKLSGLFEDKWYVIAASYNAGEKVVEEWLKRKTGLPEEEFIEEIPYTETKDYVKKVYRNWKIYRAVYKQRK